MSGGQLPHCGEDNDGEVVVHDGEALVCDSGRWRRIHDHSLVERPPFDALDVTTGTRRRAVDDEVTMIVADDDRTEARDAEAGGARSREATAGGRGAEAGGAGDRWADGGGAGRAEVADA